MWRCKVTLQLASALMSLPSSSLLMKVLLIVTAHTMGEHGPSEGERHVEKHFSVRGKGKYCKELISILTHPVCLGSQCSPPYLLMEYYIVTLLNGPLIQSSSINLLIVYLMKCSHFWHETLSSLWITVESTRIPLPWN